ncbi:MAG: type II toxin-antitoxin system RelE family toxin [Acidimicrobiales bacterium]
MTPPVRRALGQQPPEAVAAAAIDFLTTALIEKPRRVGKPLRRELTGVWSARRGTYRILYRIHEEPAEVVVVRIELRRDVYRSR